MRQITIEGTDLKTSKIGFGTASLHHIRSSSKRISILKTALNSGITHFDTARLYGNGIAEKELGKFISNINRDDITVSTKVGFHLSYFEKFFPMTSILWRKIRNILFKKKISHSVNYSINFCEESFNDSLKNLKIDSVDILFVHEPRLGDFNSIEKLIPWLKQQKSLGKTKFLGVAGEDLDSTEIFKFCPGVFDVVQTRNIKSNLYLDIQIQPQIFYGYFSNIFDSKDDALRTNKIIDQNNSMILYSSRNEQRIREFCLNY